MNSSEYNEIIKRLRDIEKKIQPPPGHFWILILLIAIAIKTQAC